MTKRSIIPESFKWSQTDYEVTLLIQEKYLQFCSYASGLSGMCNIELCHDILYYSQRTSLDILIPKFFKIPISVQLKQPIMHNETDAYYHPGVGIIITMIKEVPGQHWESFQVSEEKEFYIKQYKSLDKSVQIKLFYNKILTSKNFPKEQYAIVFQELQESLTWFFETSFEFLRNGAKLKHLLKLHNKMKSIKPEIRSCMTGFQDGSFLMAKFLFTETHLKFLKPNLISDLAYGVNEGSFIIVQATVDSQFIGIHDLVINDGLDNGVKCGVWKEVLKKDSIKKGTWMLLKEPYLHFGISRLPSITITKIEDIIFLPDSNVFQKEPLMFPHNVNAETKRNIQEIYKEQVAGIVFEYEMKDDLRITLMSFEWNSQKISRKYNTVFIQSEGDWIGAVIKEEKSVVDNCFQITFMKSVKSEIFIECLKRLIEKTPGGSLLFWRPADFKLESVAQLLLYQAGISFKGISYFTENSCSIKNIDEALQFWKLEKDNIFQEVGTLEKGKGKDNKRKDQQFSDKNMKRTYQQIQEIAEMYEIQMSKVNLIQILQKIKKNLSIEMNNSHDYFNTRKISHALCEEDDEAISENGLFYLLEYGKIIKNGNAKTKEEFSEFVVLNKISKSNIEFKLENAIKSLDLVELPVSTDVIFKQKRNEEVRLIEKIKNQKAEINSMLDQGEVDEELLICCEDQDIQSILGEFDDGESICDIESRIGEILEKNEDEEEEEVKKDLESFDGKNSTRKQTKQENQQEGFLKQEDKIELSGEEQSKREHNNSQKQFEVNVQSETDEKEKTMKCIKVSTHQQNQKNSKSSLNGFNQKKQQKNNQKMVDSGWRWVPKKQLEEAKNQLEDVNNSKIPEKPMEPVSNPQKLTITNESSDILSSYTIHSKESHQKGNEHWKEKLAERFGIDASGQSIKKMVLNEVKQTLNSQNSILKQSLRYPDRFILCNPLTKMRFILKKTFSAKTNKTIFIPITVLTKDMKFK